MTGRAGSRALRPVLPALLILTALFACKREAAVPPLAQVVSFEGKVDGEHLGSWQPAALGGALVAGDAVRTGAGATAHLRFASGREIRMAERSLIRLGVDDRSSVHVKVELGEADIEGQGAMVVSTTSGPATLDAGTRLKVRVSEQGARFEVSVGRARVGSGASEILLGMGEGVALTIGSAEVERYRVEVGTAEMEPEQPPPPPSPPGDEPEVPAVVGTERTEGGLRAVPADRIPSAVDLTLPTGESAVIHGRQTPVVIRLRLQPPCPGGGSVTLVEQGERGRSGRQRATGREHAFATVGGGNWSYQYDCGRKRMASGTLTVRRDAGTQRLPRVAPVNTIDADGRRYTVLYQNRLPALTFVWPGAPEQTGYTLQVEGKGRARRYPVDAPRLRLSSGALSEGTYQWWFIAPDGKSSAKTSISVRFDNAAVAAQVESPRDGTTIAPGTEVEVAGVALEGSTVAVGEAALPVDEQGRFRGKIPAPATDERSIAIRLTHPKSGVHYYIRRLADSGKRGKGLRPPPVAHP